MTRFLLVVVVAFVTRISALQVSQFHVIREWNYLNFTWPDDVAYQRAIGGGLYAPENCTLSGVRQYERYFYLTLPRMKNGVPATLVRIPSEVQNFDTAPLLEPYPSWSMNEAGNCESLQNVQNVEVDSRGIMWIIDGGHTNTLSRNSSINKCAPKLILHSLKTNETLRSYVFPEAVASRSFSFLYDLVVDSSDGGYAYITDNSGEDPGLIVYSYQENKSWKIRDDRTMRADPSATHLNITGIAINSPINIAPLALSPKNPTTNTRTLYYAPLSSYNLYAVNTSSLTTNKFASVNLGRKASQTASMTMDNNSILYYSLLSDTSISRWDTKQPFETSQKAISKDAEYLQWVGSFSFDNAGNLTALSNKLQKFLLGKMDLNEGNFRLMSAYVGGNSYLYGEEWSAAPTEGHKTGVPGKSHGNVRSDGNDLKAVAMAVMALGVFGVSLL